MRQGSRGCARAETGDGARAETGGGAGVGAHAAVRICTPLRWWVQVSGVYQGFRSTPGVQVSGVRVWHEMAWDGHRVWHEMGIGMVRVWHEMA